MHKVIITLMLLFSFKLSAQTCSDKIKKISDLDLTENLASEFNTDFPLANEGFGKHDFYFLVYKNPPKNSVIFMGTAHSGFMVGDKRASINKNVINTIRQIKTSQKIKTIIVENNKAQIDEFKGHMNTDFCNNVVCQAKELEPDKNTTLPAKKSILTENEIHSAVWIADPNRENIDVVAGEPAETEYLKILTDVVGISKKDYNYQTITRCLTQIKIDKTYKAAYKTWEQAYDFCTAPEKLADYKGDQQRSAYEKWFAEKSKQQPYPYVKASYCQTKGISDQNCVVESACKDVTVDTASVKSIFDSDGCYLLKLPEDVYNKKSISYIFGMIEKIRNYCLIQNILTSLEKGNVFVLYGSAHLMNTYKALKKDICSSTATTCPAPVEDIKNM